MLSDVLDAVSDPLTGMIQPERVARTLRVPVARVAEFAHVPVDVLSRDPTSTLVQEHLGEVVRIVTDASDLLGGNLGRAVLWFLHQPLAGFHGKTAAELVRDGHAGAVRAHLQMLRDGVYA